MAVSHVTLLCTQCFCTGIPAGSLPPSLPSSLSLTHLLYQLLVEQRYIWVHSRHVDVYLPECVFMNWIRPHVIVLLYKIQIFLSLSLKCLLSAINISRQVPLEKWRMWTVRERNVNPSP